MTRHAVVLAIACSFPVPLIAQAPAANPWSRVPAPPTSCLADEFPKTVSALHETMKGELAKQKETNDKVKRQLEEMDSGERMSRLQAYMMKNPQEAAKVAEAMAGSTRSQSKELMSADADKAALREQFETLEKEFRASSDAAVKPVREKQGQLVNAKTEIVFGGNHRFKSKADQDVYVDLLKQEDAAYEKACGQYFGTGGRLRSWLNDYRTKVAVKVAEATDGNDGNTSVMLAMFDISGYRPVGQLTAALDYLEKLEAMYAIRYHKAGPPQDVILIK